MSTDKKPGLRETLQHMNGLHVAQHDHLAGDRAVPHARHLDDLPDVLARLVSAAEEISQEDHANLCQCELCHALDDLSNTYELTR
jgi:hypothetical protein